MLEQVDERKAYADVSAQTSDYSYSGRQRSSDARLPQRVSHTMKTILIPNNQLFHQ